MTSYKNGSTAGMAGRNPNPSKRGNVTGWSAAAVRRHTKWLYSVDTEALGGEGFSFTLTLKHTPPTAEAFHSLRDAWIKRLKRIGATRVHWVIEWQKRGTPHIHAAVYFDALLGDHVGPEWDRSEITGITALCAWTSIADPLYGAVLEAQHYGRIDGPLGWLQYLSKHASRGVKHYQRSGHPEGWDRTGRLWGHGGEWPVEAPARYDMSSHAYWRYRRLVRAWRVADARASGDPKRIKYARRMLACPDPRLSAVRGVSDWLPESVSLQLVALLVSEGYDISERTQ